MKKIFFLLMSSLLATGAVNAQSADEKKVAQAVETLRKAMVDGDKATLESITAPELSYGHSNANVEDKATFVHSLVSKKYDFVSINLADQTIRVVGNTALVRHHLTGKSEDAGKAPADVNLGVLTVWQKQQGKWKLLARQAFKM